MATSQLDIKVTGVGDLDKATQAINDGAGSVTNLKTELRTLQQELQTLDPSSDKFIQLSQQAGELRDKIKGTSEAVNANAGPAFERLGNNASLLTSKLSSLDFGGAAESVKALAANVKGVDFKTLGTEIGTFGKSLLSLGKALLANPIFLLAAAVAAVIVNFDKLVKIIPGLNNLLTGLNGILTGVTNELAAALVNSEKLTAEARAQLEATTASENSLKLRGLTEKEILQIKKLQTNELINSLKAQQSLQDQITMSQIETAKRNRDILAGVLEFIAIPIRALLTQIDLVGKAVGQDFGLVKGFKGILESVAELAFNPDEILAKAKETRAATDKEIQGLINARDGYQIQLTAIDRRGAEERDKLAKSEADKRKKEQEELAKNAEEISDIIRQLEEQTAEEERKAQFEANQRRLKQEEDYYNLFNELTQTEQEKEIAALTAAYDEKFLLAQGNADLEKLLAEKQGEDIAKINEKYAKAEKEKQRDLQRQKIELAGSAIDALIQLNDAFAGSSEKSARKAFAINKALSLVQALQNTYLGATSAFAQTPGGIGIKIAAASIAVAAGLANVARIARSKFEPSGGGGGETGGGGAPSISNGGGGAVADASTPQFSALNTGFLQGGTQTPPVQAYVLGQDVADTLQASEKIRDQSTL
jgi:hypothetical protein